jgi:hypothetical protein
MPELKGMTGIRFSHSGAKRQGMQVDLEVNRPVKVLIGFFQSRDASVWLQAPDPETNSAAAEQGPDQPLLRNAICLSQLPSVDVHVLGLAAGQHTLDFGRGSYLILGVVDGSEDIPERDDDPPDAILF